MTNAAQEQGSNQEESGHRMIGTSGHREDQNQEPQRTQRNAEEEAQARVPVPHDHLRVVEPSETGGSSARPGAGKYPDTEWLTSVHRAGPGDAWQTIVTHDYKVVKVSDEKHYAHLSPSYVADTIRTAFGNLGLATGSNIVSIRKAG